MGILATLVSKLRAVAKNSSKNCQNKQKQVFGLFCREENSCLQEFKFLSTKFVGEWDG